MLSLSYCLLLFADDYNPDGVSSEDDSVSSGVEEVDSSHPSEEEVIEDDIQTPISSNKASDDC